MHLLLLLSLAAVSHLSASEYTELNSGGSADISGCPIRFYGRTYDKLYLDKTADDKKYALCLKGKYKAGDKNVCILTDVGGVDKVKWKKLTTEKKPQSEYHKALPKLTGTSKCQIEVKLWKGSSDLSYITFAQFGDTHGAVELYSGPLKYEVQVDDVKQEELLLGDGNLSYHDVTGCKTSPGRSSCGSGEICKADGQCMLEATCTVTGSTVISDDGKTASVPDRCAYTLMQESTVQLVGIFKDRRRQDVYLLDHVILQKETVKIVLEQGGKVKVDDTELTLTSSQTKHGVEFTKDGTGVTAKLVHSGVTTSIFFNGYTVQIHMKGPGGKTVEGYCFKPDADASTLKSADDSSKDCEAPHTDSTATGIDEDKVTARCEILKKDPFTPCNTNIPPEPYIKACTNTLKKYPEADGLSSCEFLENYARACNLHTKDTLVNWRTTAQCSAPKAVCQNKFCSSDEYCTEEKCFCRAIFASTYKKDKTFGDEAVCADGSASVTLVGCLLEEKYIDYSVLHLNDANCKGQMDSKTHKVTFGFDSSDTCGTVIKVDKTKITYENSIKADTTSGSIVNHAEVKLDFSCFYKLPVTNPKALSFKVKVNSHTHTYTAGTWSYTVTTKAYTDAGRTEAVKDDTEIKLAQTIWVELKTTGLNDKLVNAMIDSCWATKEESSKDPKYDLIKDSCPDDKTVKVEANGLGTSPYFSFNMFQFAGSNDVSLHCSLKLCEKKKQGETCVPTCGSKRRRRSARSNNEDAHPAFITMTWTN